MASKMNAEANMTSQAKAPVTGADWKRIEVSNFRAECVPGRIYCCFVVEDDGNTRDGLIVCYAGDGEFYDADDGEQCYPDFDYLVEQPGSFNPEFAQ